MGKKHNKFKKHGTAKHITSAQTAPTSATYEVAESSVVPAEMSKPEKVDEMELLNEKYAFVRHDVRKLGIVLGSLVILFIATYFLNTHTTILTNLGDWIYKVGHFSI
jgi:hypothetical protein